MSILPDLLGTLLATAFVSLSLAVGIGRLDRSSSQRPRHLARH